MIPWERGLKQLSSVCSDFLVFTGLVDHVHLTEFGVCEKDGYAEFTINELYFGISRQGLMSFEDSVFLSLTILRNLMNFFLSFGFV